MIEAAGRGEAKRRSFAMAFLDFFSQSFGAEVRKVSLPYYSLNHHHHHHRICISLRREIAACMPLPSLPFEEYSRVFVSGN
jgi:hypothetical protein